MHQSTKTYGHEVGLSACFRQHKATSHCNRLHGYALAVSLKFQAVSLDERNWVMDFGGLKPVKALLEDLFDHKLLVAFDDPHLGYLRGLEALGLADLVVMKAVGCEAFAEHIYFEVRQWMMRSSYYPRVVLVSVEVREHGANSAIYVGSES